MIGLSRPAIFRDAPQTGIVVAYTLLGVWAVVSLLAFVWILGLPPKAVAHKSDIVSALGPTTEAALVKKAEQAVAQQAGASSVTLTGQKVISVSTSKDRPRTASTVP